MQVRNGLGMLIEDSKSLIRFFTRCLPLYYIPHDYCWDCFLLKAVLYVRHHLVFFCVCASVQDSNPRWVVTKTGTEWNWTDPFFFRILCPEAILYLSLDPSNFDLGIPNPKLTLPGNQKLRSILSCSIPFWVLVTAPRCTYDCATHQMTALLPRMCPLESTDL